MKYTHTKYVFYTEADFIPMSGLAEYAYHTAMSLNVSKLVRTSAKRRLLLVFILTHSSIALFVCY